MVRHSAVAAELVKLSALLQARSTLGPHPAPGLEDTPMCLHAGYGAREFLTAVGWRTALRRVPFQAGTLSLLSRKTELLFVTLDNSEGYHDRIAYHEYAICAERFSRLRCQQIVDFDRDQDFELHAEICEGPSPGPASLNRAI